MYIKLMSNKIVPKHLANKTSSIPSIGSQIRKTIGKI